MPPRPTFLASGIDPRPVLDRVPYTVWRAAAAETPAALFRLVERYEGMAPEEAQLRLGADLEVNHACGGARGVWPE